MAELPRRLSEAARALAATEERLASTLERLALTRPGDAEGLCAHAARARGFAAAARRRAATYDVGQGPGSAAGYLPPEPAPAAADRP